MADYFARVYYPAVAAVGTYPIPFPALDRSHIVFEVTPLDGNVGRLSRLPASAVTLVGDALARVVAPLGSTLLIRRETPPSAAGRLIGPGTVSSARINEANTAERFLREELHDELTTIRARSILLPTLQGFEIEADAEGFIRISGGKASIAPLSILYVFKFVDLDGGDRLDMGTTLDGGFYPLQDFTNYDGTVRI